MYAIQSLRLRALADDVDVKITYIGTANKPIGYATGTLTATERADIASITGEAIPGGSIGALLEISADCVVMPAYGVDAAEVAAANDGQTFSSGILVLGKDGTIRSLNDAGGSGAILAQLVGMDQDIVKGQQQTIAVDTSKYRAFGTAAGTGTAPTTNSTKARVVTIGNADGQVGYFWARGDAATANNDQVSTSDGNPENPSSNRSIYLAPGQDLFVTRNAAGGNLRFEELVVE